MNELEQVEMSIEEAQSRIDRKRNMIKLLDHPVFEEIILKGYMEKEALRLTMLRGEAAMQTTDQQTYLNKSSDAIAFFDQFIRTVLREGLQAETDLKAYRETQEELLTEDLIN